MDETHTLDALVQFLYHDMPAEDAYLTAKVLENNTDMRATYVEMLASKVLLPKVTFTPSNNVVNRIMQYSATTMDNCSPMSSLIY
ncbi:MAG: hypothetical protein RIR11_4601 [Bacteroidota bacterium]|jgi:hypothetical protein